MISVIIFINDCFRESQETKLISFIQPPYLLVKIPFSRSLALHIVIASDHLLFIYSVKSKRLSTTLLSSRGVVMTNIHGIPFLVNHP